MKVLIPSSAKSLVHVAMLDSIVRKVRNSMRRDAQVQARPGERKVRR